MRKIIILGLMLNTLISCNETPEYKFKKNGVLITSPTGWAIVEEENFDNEGYFLSIERDGFDSSGLITFSWLNDSLNIEDSIEAHIYELKNNIIYKNSNIIFEPISNSEFNKISSRSSSYKLSLLGIKHEGIIHLFYGKNRTYIVLKQEAIEDKSKNESGFNMIEESFKID